MAKDVEIITAITTLGGELHSKMEELGAEIGDVKTNVAVLGEKMKHLEPPCSYLQETKKVVTDHVDAHLETRRTVKTKLIAGGIGLIFLVVGAAFVAWLKIGG